MLRLQEVSVTFAGVSLSFSTDLHAHSSHEIPPEEPEQTEDPTLGLPDSFRTPERLCPPYTHQVTHIPRSGRPFRCGS